MHLIPSLLAEDAAENLLEALAKVFGHQGVNDGVEAGVGVGHAVGQQPEGIGGLIEGKVSIEVAQNHYMVRQPADAKEHRDYNDHLGDLALCSFRLRHPIKRVDCCPEVLDGAGVGQAHDQHRNNVAKNKGACVQNLTVMLFPSRHAHIAVLEIDEVVVTQVRPSENQRQAPDDHHCYNSITRRSQFSGAQRVTNGQIPVHRHRCQCETASIHGEVDEEVNHLAHEGPENPTLQGVDGCLERHAEDDEEEIGYAEVEDEQIGGVVPNLPTSKEHSQHQTVPDGPQEEDEREDH